MPAIVKSKEEIEESARQFLASFKAENETLKKVGVEFDVAMVKDMFRRILSTRASERLAERISNFSDEEIAALHLALFEEKPAAPAKPGAPKPKLKTEKTTQH